MQPRATIISSLVSNAHIATPLSGVLIRPLIAASVAPGVQPRVHKAQLSAMRCLSEASLRPMPPVTLDRVFAQISGIHANIAYDLIRKGTYGQLRTFIALRRCLLHLAHIVADAA